MSPRLTTASTRKPKSDSVTSAIVATGRPVASPRMPGISPERRRPRRGGLGGRVRRAALGLGSDRVPSRSIFGARLRSRVPQYGHSVMYGLTSDPHFLQTTKRSGDAMDAPMIRPGSLPPARLL